MVLLIKHFSLNSLSLSQTRAERVLKEGVLCVCVCVSSSSRESERVCVKQRWRKTLFFVCDWLCCKKLSVETLNPNSVGAHFEGAFFWPKWWKALALASIRAAKLERRVPLSSSLVSTKRKRRSLCCWCSFCRHLVYDRRSPERERERESEREHQRDPSKERERENFVFNFLWSERNRRRERIRLSFGPKTVLEKLEKEGKSERGNLNLNTHRTVFVANHQTDIAVIAQQKRV